MIKVLNTSFPLLLVLPLLSRPVHSAVLNDCGGAALEGAVLILLFFSDLSQLLLLRKSLLLQGIPCPSQARKFGAPGVAGGGVQLGALGGWQRLHPHPTAKNTLCRATTTPSILIPSLHLLLPKSSAALVSLTLLAHSGG